MIVYLSFLCLNILTVNTLSESDPIIKTWIKSTGKGYANILTNIIKIRYSATHVYINTNSIPSYTIGPWKFNPNNAAQKDFTFKIPRTPTPKTGVKTKVGLGHIGIWSNGVSVFNADDGMTYNNLGVWNRNAFVWEGISFDACQGHPAPNGEYHHHISPNCMFSINSATHSPLIGYAFDGYPIYGPYGYSSAMDTTSPIKRIESSYKLRSITKRQILANGTVLQPSQYGPDVNAQYILGSFIQDFEFQSGLGDLDQYNGRFCKTPEYPNGVYAYFTTIDKNLAPAYPFIIGPYYYGNVQMENVGPNSGKIIVTEPVVTYYDYAV